MQNRGALLKLEANILTDGNRHGAVVDFAKLKRLYAANREYGTISYDEEYQEITLREYKAFDDGTTDPLHVASSDEGNSEEEGCVASLLERTVGAREALDMTSKRRGRVGIPKGPPPRRKMAVTPPPPRAKLSPPQRQKGRKGACESLAHWAIHPHCGPPRLRQRGRVIGQ